MPRPPLFDFLGDSIRGFYFLDLRRLLLSSRTVYPVALSFQAPPSGDLQLSWFGTFSPRAVNTLFFSCSITQLALTVRLFPLPCLPVKGRVAFAGFPRTFCRARYFLQIQASYLYRIGPRVP